MHASILGVCRLTAFAVLATFCLLTPSLATAFPADFDNDDISDLVVYRPYDHVISGVWYSRWYVKTSTGVCPSPMSAVGTGCYFDWGLPGDKPLSGDFDADGRADFTVYRSSNLTWYIYFSNGGGSAAVPPADTGMQVGDQPDETDYNNDGRSDIVHHRPSTRIFYYRLYVPSSSPPLQYGQHSRGYFISGLTSHELDPPVMVSHQYQGSAAGDIAVRVPLIVNSNFCLPAYPSSNAWAYTYANVGFSTGFCVSAANLTDVAVAGNFGGVAVNLADFVRWTTSGNWYFSFNSGPGHLPENSPIAWGLSGDIPVGFETGSGISVPTVYRPSEGNWYVKTAGTCPGASGFLTNPSSGVCVQQWGLSGDIPVS